MAAALFDPSAQPAAEAGEYGLLQGLHWLCASLAGDDVLLLTIDDVQWADAASLRFVHYLLGRLGELPVLIVLARCTGEPAAQPELLATIAAAPVTRLLRPQPLSPAAVDPARRGAARREMAPPRSRGLPRRQRRQSVPPAGAAGRAWRRRGPRPAAVAPRRSPSTSCRGLSAAHRRDRARAGRRRPGAGRPAARRAALAGLEEPAALEAAGALADHGVLRCGRRLALRASGRRQRDL